MEETSGNNTENMKKMPKMQIMLYDEEDQKGLMEKNKEDIYQQICQVKGRSIKDQIKRASPIEEEEEEPINLKSLLIKRFLFILTNLMLFVLITVSFISYGVSQDNGLSQLYSYFKPDTSYFQTEVICFTINSNLVNMCLLIMTIYQIIHFAKERKEYKSNAEPIPTPSNKNLLSFTYAIKNDDPNNCKKKSELIQKLMVTSLTHTYYLGNIFFLIFVITFGSSTAKSYGITLSFGFLSSCKKFEFKFSILFDFIYKI
jgi:hypothetical protein